MDMVLEQTVADDRETFFSFSSNGFSHRRNEDVDAFYSKITEGLDNLERLLAPNFITSDCLLHAVEFLSALHSGLIDLADKLQLPASLQGEGWLADYMDETVKMLDVCNALKAGVTGMEQYLNRVVVVIGATPYRMNHALDTCRDEMERLETENKILVESKFEADGNLRLNLSGDYVESKFAKWNGFWGVMFAVKNISSFVSWLLLWGLVYAGNSISFKMETVSFRSPWSASFLRLQQRVNEAIVKVRQANNAPTTFLNEFKSVQIIMTDLLAHREETTTVRKSQQQLRRCSTILKEKLEPLDWRINDLLDVIVEGRRKLLETCSNSSS